MRQWRIGSMEGGRTINLKKLTMEELAGVVNLYPWFAGARKELCERMAALGGESWGVSQYADQAMYVADRSIIAGIMQSSAVRDYSDSNLESLLSSYMEEQGVGAKEETGVDAVAQARKSRLYRAEISSQRMNMTGSERPGTISHSAPRTAGKELRTMPEMTSVLSSAPRHWQKFMPNKAILSSQDAFIANFFWHSRKKVLTLHLLLKNWTN